MIANVIYNSYSDRWLRVMIGQFHNAQSSLSRTGQHDIQSGITTGSTVSWQRWPESRKWSCYAVFKCVQCPERLSGCLALISICNHPSSFFALRHHTSCAASSHKHPWMVCHHTVQSASAGFPATSWSGKDSKKHSTLQWHRTTNI